MLKQVKQYLIIFKLEVLQFVLKIFYLFPVKNGQLFFSSYRDKYSCSPKYIYEYLKLIYRNKLVYIWVCYNEYNINDSNTIFVKYKTIKYIYYLLTSKIIISNDDFPSWAPFRKNQVLINTWHGGGAYKKVGIDNINNNNISSLYVLNKIGTRTNYFISSSKIFSNLIAKARFIDNKKFLPFGMPRNDIFFSSTINSAQIRQRIGIDQYCSVILYAPTYRGLFNFNTTNINDININYLAVLDAAKQRFEKNFILLYRSHHAMNNIFINNDLFINVTNYPDMQELLYITDILITDYSSSMWDFSLTFKPGFLYTPDIQEYIDSRGLYTPISEWPYPYATTNYQLCENILKYCEKENTAKIKKHHSMLESYENGNATETFFYFVKDELELSKN